MTIARVNGVELFYELSCSGEPLVLVHGSWVDHANWAAVAPTLAESFQVLAYDRRGHSQSERPKSQGSVHEDAEDLAALIQELDLSPAHVVCNSFGGNIAMRLAVRRPELFRSLSLHEPPVFALLADDPAAQPLLEANGASIAAVAEKIAAGEHEAGARQFVEEVAFGPGAWENELPPDGRETFVFNAPTFLDETQDQPGLGVDLDGLSSFERPVLLSEGDRSPPIFPKIIAKLDSAFPNAERKTLPGAAHVPQLTHPALYAETVARFAAASASA